MGNLKYIFDKQDIRPDLDKVYRIMYITKHLEEDKTNRDERCCRASWSGPRSCRNRCVCPLGCCSGGNGPQSRKIGSNSEKRSSQTQLWNSETLMKTVWCSEPVMRGLSLPRTNLSSSTGHLPIKPANQSPQIQ